MAQDYDIIQSLGGTEVSRLFGGQTGEGTYVLVHEFFLRPPTEEPGAGPDLTLIDPSRAFVLGGRPTQHKQPHQEGVLTCEEWFEREVLRVTHFRVRGLPTVRAAGVADGRGLLVLGAYGETLAEQVCEQGPLPVKKALALGSHLLDLVAPLHQVKPFVVFGEISPYNIYMGPDGHPHMLTFGELRFVDPPRRPAVLAYASVFTSPERRSGSLESPCSDLYCIGATLYFALTGRYPDADGGRSLLANQFNPEVEMSLARTLSAAMDGVALNRFQSTNEMREALQGKQPVGERVKEAPPIITLDRTEILEADVLQGTQLSGWIQVNNTGGGTLHGKVATDASWLTVNPMELKGNREMIQYWIATAKLPPGMRHTGHIHFGLVDYQHESERHRGQQSVTLPVHVDVRQSPVAANAGGISIGCVFRALVPLFVVAFFVLKTYNFSVKAFLRAMGLL